MNDFGTFNNPVWTVADTARVYFLIGIVGIIVICLLYLALEGLVTDTIKFVKYLIKRNVEK